MSLHVFFPLGFFPQILSHAMKLCILFLFSMKWRSDHEQCIKLYEEHSAYATTISVSSFRRDLWMTRYEAYFVLLPNMYFQCAGKRICVWVDEV